jgi:hypothetical protein
MRRHFRMRTGLAVLNAFVCADPVVAQTDMRPQSAVVAMAQHFVQEHLMHESTENYHIKFDIAYIPPQPQTNFWAVVGGFVSNHNVANTYGTAVRLMCRQFKRVECWRLDKLAIKRTIILNRGDPV